MKKDSLMLGIGILAVIAGLFVGNSKVALLISLIIAVISFLRKETGIIFLLIFIPIRPFLITLNPGFKILGDAIIGLLLIRTLWDSRKDFKKLFSFHPFEWAFFAFAAIGIVSALITGVSLKAIIVQVRAYFLFYLVYYIVKRMYFSSQTIWKMSATTFVMALILSIQGIIEKITSKTALMPQEWQEWDLSPTNRVRVYGLIKGPNELSLYLLLAFFITLHLLKSIRGKMRYLLYTGLVLMGTTILLTYSRGTILTLIVFLIVYVVVNSKEILKGKWRKLISIGIMAIISVVMFFGVNKLTDVYYDKYVAGHADEWHGKDDQAGSERYKKAFSEETIGQSNTSGRIYYVKKSLQILKDHPIIGTGFGTFGGAATLAYSSPIYKHYHIKTDFYSDNQYILILAETGILGMLAVFIIGFNLLVITWKNRKEYYGPLLSYLYVGLIIGGVVYNILENDSFMMFYFMLLGLVFQKRQTTDTVK